MQVHILLLSLCNIYIGVRTKAQGGKDACFVLTPFCVLQVADDALIWCAGLPSMCAIVLLTDSFFLAWPPGGTGAPTWPPAPQEWTASQLWSSLPALTARMKVAASSATFASSDGL